MWSHAGIGQVFKFLANGSLPVPYVLEYQFELRKPATQWVSASSPPAEAPIPTQKIVVSGELEWSRILPDCDKTN
ncbi:MAG: hypothetical protein IPJ38_15490 [Dechloromonas sp.]|uniref:Uncharacterized protein n=1 Tax=Candidatus Dechloromonas phosphorivorans TaxID=2899244 RepID=A0A935K153_9RHOO|nr:hypothetical protein [Candidatus Dechloromonas phosphorivorans]